MDKNPLNSQDPKLIKMVQELKVIVDTYADSMPTEISKDYADSITNFLSSNCQ
jgi:hypothetical protein